MMRRLLVPSLIVLLACGGASHPLPSTPVGDHGVQVANLTAQLPPYIESIGGGAPGVAFNGFVLVAQHDQVLYAHGFGYANVETKRPPTADTSFRIGSVTKQFTAAAILQLEQAGKLSVDDPVSKLIPEFPGPGRDVTIHQLLTHTGGIHDYTHDATVMERRERPFTPQQLLESFWSAPLEFPPGSKHEYSNSGYIILGAIIERVSGMPYARYMKTKLFDPAGLTHTEVGDAPTAADRALGYEPQNGALVAAHPIDMSVPFAAGAIRSTANDLLRWHRALSTPGLLSDTERERLYHPALDNYAYGWNIHDTRDGAHHIVWHNGGIDGFGTSYWRVLDADLVVVVWSNVEGIRVDPVAEAAIQAAFGQPLTPDPKLQPGTLDTAITARLAGIFAIDPDGIETLKKLGAPPEMLSAVATIELTATPAGVQAKPAGQPAIELLPQADGSFLNTDHHIRITADPSGQKFQLEQGPLKIGYTRR